MVINMCEYNNVPKIRFKGFTDVWEQRKLGDECFELIAGGDIDKTRSVNNGKYPIYANALTNDGIVGYYNDSYRVKSPAVTITGRGEIGYAMARNTDFTPVVRLISLRSKHNNYFLANAINLLNVVSESTGVPQLTIPQVEKFDIYFPKNINEEIKLGRLFNEIDNLITLHQRKCDTLVNAKKSLLEKMFPKNSSNIPEIRFKGFTDVWEQRKVTDIGNISIGLVTTMTKHYTDSGTLLIRNSDIKDNKFEFSESPIFLDKEFAEKNKSRQHRIGDVITVHTGDVGTSAVITENEANSIGFATIITRPKKNIITSNYLSTFLNTEKHKKWAVAISTGDGRTNYNLGDYYKLVLPVPNISEQEKISDFILKLDNLITLHQRKLEKLKNIKKSMLDKMFV